MTTLKETFITVDGVETRVLTGGKIGSPKMVLLHGGAPGLSPYCGGTHLWGSALLDALSRSMQIIVPDLLASGGTAIGEGPLTIDRMIAHAKGVIAATSAGDKVHVVGHDLGGMVALSLAFTAPQLLAALTIVSSQAAAPTGDGVENLTLLAPPRPLWSRESQVWAYDRLSYSHHHITNELIEASVAAAHKGGHLKSVRSEASTWDNDLFISILRAKSRFFKAAREGDIQVPTQVIWAKNDPLVTIDHGLWLYRIIAGKQRAAHFHLINRSGNFPFREQPEEFSRVLKAFQSGLSG